MMLRGLLAAAIGACALLGTTLAAAQAVLGVVQTTGSAIAVDPATHRAYVAGADPTLVVLDGTAIVQRITLRAPAFGIALDSLHQRLYVSHFDNTLSIIDAQSGRLTALVPGVTGLVRVNERLDRAFVADSRTANSIAMIDGNGTVLRTLALPSFPCAMAVNADTNQVYVVHCSERQSGASVIDVDTFTVTWIPIAEHVPVGVALDPATNRAYVVGGDGGTLVTVIDGATKQYHAIRTGGSPTPRPSYIAVNSPAGRVYAVFGSQFVVIDSANENVIARVQLEPVTAMKVDAPANRLYIAYGRTLATFDATTGAMISAQPLPVQPMSMDVDAAMRRLYTGGVGGLVIDTSRAPGPPLNNYQGLWWGAPGGSESGWGVNIAQQGDVWFAAWYTYDSEGDPTWFVMPAGSRTSGEAFGGTLYRVTARSSWQSDPFDSSTVVSTPVGTLSFSFSDASNGSMVAVVNGTRISKSITRLNIGTPPLACDINGTATSQNYTDLWWKAPAGSESGWGLFLTHQGNTIFGVWFTFVNEKPAWFTSTMTKDDSQSGATVKVYRGDLFRTSGPPFTTSPFSGAPWDASRVRPVAIGNMSVAFSDYDKATFTFTLGFVTRTKNVERTRFATLASACR